MSAVRVEPYSILRERNGLIGRFQSGAEIARQYEIVGYAANPVDEKIQIVSEFFVVGTEGNEALSDGEAVAIGPKRLVELALRLKHVADVAVGDRQIALPAGVAGIGLRQPLPEGEAVAVAIRSPGNVSPCSGPTT